MQSIDALSVPLNPKYESLHAIEKVVPLRLNVPVQL